MGLIRRNKSINSMAWPSVTISCLTFAIDIGDLEPVPLGCNLFLALLGCKPDLFALGISFSLLAVVVSCFLQITNTNVFSSLANNNNKRAKNSTA